MKIPARLCAHTKECTHSDRLGKFKLINKHTTSQRTNVLYHLPVVRLSFRLIVQIYRTGIQDDELWELNPRDQSETFIPRVQKTWAEEVEKSKRRQ